MKNRRLIVQIAAAVFAIALAAFVFRDVDLGAAVATIGDMGWLALLALVPFGVNMVFDANAWGDLLRGLGRRARTGPLFLIRIAADAFIVAMACGSFVAEGLGPVLLDKKVAIPLSVSIPASSVRKALLVLTQGAYVAGGAIAGFAALDAASETFGVAGLPWIVLVAAAILCAAGALGLGLLLGGEAARRVFAGILALSRRSAWLHARIAKLAPGADSADRALRDFDRRALIAPALGYFVTWMLEAVETWLILRLLGADVDFVLVWAFEPALSLVRHVFFFLPAGLGVQDAGYVVFLRAIGVDDPLTLGAAFVLVKRAKEIAWALIGFAAFAPLSTLRFPNALVVSPRRTSP